MTMGPHGESATVVIVHVVEFSGLVVLTSCVRVACVRALRLTVDVVVEVDAASRE